MWGLVPVPGQEQERGRVRELERVRGDSRDPLAMDGGKEADLPDGLVGVSAGAGGGGKALKGGGWGMEGV